MRSQYALALAALAAACTPVAETAEQAEARMATESAAAREFIEAANAEFVQHFNQGHGDVVAATYTEDGVLMIVGAPVARGRQAIAAMVSGLAPMQPQLTITAQEVVANGPMAVERGTYSLTLTPPGAPGPVTESGTFVVYWRRMGDHWMRAWDIATSDKPLPPPA